MSIIHSPYQAPELYYETKKLNYQLCDRYAVGRVILRAVGVPEQTLINIPAETQKDHNEFIANLISAFV